MGWDKAKLEALIHAVGEQNSSGILILLNGKDYWQSNRACLGEAF
jgi:hypothetical protein